LLGLGDRVKTRLNKETNLREVRAIPKGVGYVVEVVYEKEVEEPKNVNEDRIAGIDLGVTNLATVGNNIGEKPIVVKGGICKSINQFYNKEMGRIQRIYESQKIRGKRVKSLKNYLISVTGRLKTICIKLAGLSLIIALKRYWNFSYRE
jgi:Probable transposase.